MTHGDDDGLRLPPAIAPRQVVIVPMLRDKPEDAAGAGLLRGAGDGADGRARFGERLRALLDTQATESADKRWNWVRRGAPIIVEIGPRDAASGQVTFMRRDALRDGDKIASPCHAARRVRRRGARRMLAEIQAALFAEAKARLDAQHPHATSRPSTSWPSISARRRTTRTTARLQGLGARAVVRGRPARSWRRSTRG